MKQIELNINDLFIKKHQKILVDALKHKHTHYTLSGGRGGAKSSAIGLNIPLLMVQPENKDVNAVVFRKTANTMRDSVYAQVSTGISMLGLDSYFKRTVSPMEITYRPTGQKILFRGVDQPEKIKSIKAQYGYFGITWFEELDQFAGREEIRKITQSTMRGQGGKFWNFESYNPPISRDNWANKDILFERSDRLICHTNYLDVPKSWLSETFITEAEILKELDPRAYEHEYLGIPVGTGGNVFDKIEKRTLSSELIKKFDRIYQGIDWGWYPDQLAFIRLHYDTARQTIYILDELYVNKYSNEQLAKWIYDKKYHNIITTCDSAEPKSVYDIHKMGIRSDSAIKGAGSVEYSMKWLQRRKIVIDPKRTPNAYNEFAYYEYERNRENEIISGYPDKNNHLIDATRYALERVWRSSKTVA